jgi:uncharacterized protein YndB with AHSA1/START domain
MPDILHDLYIAVSPGEVFRGVTEPGLLDEWWTKKCSGVPAIGGEYELYFSPEYVWRARVSQVEAGKAFELAMFQADADWEGTRVGFMVQPQSTGTKLRFYHSGWREANEHFRISSYCWATYLRILKRFLEKGERVIYEKRDEA